MNRRQTYRGSGVYVGWMRGMFVYDNSLSSMDTWRSGNHAL